MTKMYRSIRYKQMYTGLQKHSKEQFDYDWHEQVYGNRSLAKAANKALETIKKLTKYLNKWKRTAQPKPPSQNNDWSRLLNENPWISTNGLKWEYNQIFEEKVDSAKLEELEGEAVEDEVSIQIRW